MKTNNLGMLLAFATTEMIGCAASKPAQTAAPGAAPGTASAELVHCYGVNQCKGHNDCKTADNSCAGHSECKGHGFVAMSGKACGDIGGALQDDYRGEVASTDLVHCYGVNQCKGHNDCKTADNACAGHAECKGHGFVAVSDKACGDVGGEVGA